MCRHLFFEIPTIIRSSLKSSYTYKMDTIGLIWSTTDPPKIDHSIFHIKEILLEERDRSLHIKMAIRMPRIIQAKKVLGRSFSNWSRSSSSSVDIIPKGHLAVYVGDQEKRRFVVPLSLLDQPSFQDLLRQSEEEFGYDHPMGGLTIPCREDVFIHVASGLVCSLWPRILHSIR